MQLHDIAWAALRRRPGRAAFTVAVVAIAIGTVVTLVAVTGAMQTEIGDELDRFGANIVVTPRAQSLDLAYGGVAVAGLTVDARDLRAEDADAIRTIPNRKNVNAVAPKLLGTAEIAGVRVLLIGVRQDEEARVKSWWHVDGRLAKTADELVLGADAAKALQAAPGVELPLGGRPRRVTGILAATGTLDDGAVVADIDVVQQVLGRPGAVSMIEVSALCGGCPIEHMVEQIATVLPHARVAPIRQAVAARERAVLQFTRFAYALSLIVLAVGTLVVTATMMASVAERTQEIGILRAVGYRRSHVARVILTESVLLNLAGGLTGWVFGLAATRVLAPAVAPSAAYVTPDLALGLVATAAAILLGALAGGYPAVRATRMEPSHALRSL